jgi:phospholipase A-2-activating protein
VQAAVANNGPAIVSKILSTNQNMLASGRKEFAFNPTDEKVVQALREALAKSQPIGQDGFQRVVRIVASWDYGDKMPGLDLLRCVAPTPFVAQYKDHRYDSVVDLAINSSLDTPTDGIAPNENCVMLAVRTIVNLFLSEEGRRVAGEQAQTVVGYLERIVGLDQQPAIGKYNRNLLIAVTTAILNFSVLASKTKAAADQDLVKRFMAILGNVLTDQKDGEVVYRALVALGTLATAVPGVDGAEAKAWVIGAVAKVEEDRIKKIAEECLGRLR